MPEFDEITYGDEGKDEDAAFREWIAEQMREQAEEDKARWRDVDMTHAIVSLPIERFEDGPYKGLCKTINTKPCPVRAAVSLAGARRFFDGADGTVRGLGERFGVSHRDGGAEGLLGGSAADIDFGC